MKYIIFNDFAELPVAILFPDRINYAEMREQIPYTKVISAGHVETVQNDGIRCWGTAPDLNISSRPDEDAKLILKQFAETDPNS